jgi:hypothetical protein
MLTLAILFFVGKWNKPIPEGHKPQRGYKETSERQHEGKATYTLEKTTIQLINQDRSGPWKKSS